MRTLSFVTRKGAEIDALFEDLAHLRIQIFKDFPYLYQGSIEYEKVYLETYSKSPKSLLFAVYDGNDMVGATTCLPLADETPEVIAPFERAKLEIDTIFYFGESILRKEYRGFGLGHRFFEEREQHARHLRIYKTACFCVVERGDDHPAKPADYRPNDVFWIRRGYAKEPRLQSLFEWTDIGEAFPTAKTMTYWTKQL